MREIYIKILRNTMLSSIYIFRINSKKKFSPCMNNFFNLTEYIILQLSVLYIMKGREIPRETDVIDFEDSSMINADSQMIPREM